MMLAKLIRITAAPLYHRQVLKRLDCVTGLENIPRTGPVVIVSNHTSYADHFVILTLLHAVRPGEVWFPTKAEAFERFASRIWHESMRCFPVQRDAPTQSIFTTAQAVLEAGHVLVLYPEGTRGDGGDLLPLKSGAFRMALAGDAPVIPIGMWNVHRVLPKGERKLNPDMISVAVGKALLVPSTDDTKAVAHMRDDARHQLETLRAQARRTNALDRLNASQAVAQLAGQIITENLSPAGSISKAVLHRSNLLLALGLAISRRSEASLSIQSARLRGLKALSSWTPVTRLPRFIVTNVQATRLAEQNPSDAFAAYLAGRTNLMTPPWAGGGAERAKCYFKRAVKDKNLASKAYLGLGLALRRGGCEEAAQQAWLSALAELDPSDPRGGSRRQRIEALMNQTREDR